MVRRKEALPIGDELFQECLVKLPLSQSFANFKAKEDIWVLEQNIRLYMCYPEDVREDRSVKRETPILLPIKDIVDSGFAAGSNQGSRKGQKIVMNKSIKSERGDELGNKFYIYFRDQAQERHFDSVIRSRRAILQQKSAGTPKRSRKVVDKGSARVQGSQNRRLRLQTTPHKVTKSKSKSVSFSDDIVSRSPSPDILLNNVPAPTPSLASSQRSTMEQSINEGNEAQQDDDGTSFSNLDAAHDQMDDFNRHEVDTCDAVIEAPLAVQSTPPTSTHEHQALTPPVASQKRKSGISQEQQSKALKTSHVLETHDDNAAVIALSNCLGEVTNVVLSRWVEAKKKSEHVELTLQENLRKSIQTGRERFENTLITLETDLKDKIDYLEAQHNEVSEELTRAMQVHDRMTGEMQDNLNSIRGQMERL